MDTIELWESEITNQPGFFETMNEQIDFLCESVELDYKLLEMGVLTEDGNNIGETIEEKLKVFLIKIVLFLSKIGSKIGFFIKKFIDNAKLKVLEKKIKDADPEKIKAYMSKANLYDPDKIAKELDSTGLIDYFAGAASALDIEDLPVYKSNKIAKSGADIPPFAIQIIQGFKYTVKDGSVSEITQLTNNTSDLIKVLNGYVDAYKKNIEGFKSKIKTLDTSNKEQIKEIKSFISLGKSCISGIQKITKLMINQYITLTKIQIKLAKYGVEDPKENYDEFDDFLDDWDEEEFFEDIDEA